MTFDSGVKGLQVRATVYKMWIVCHPQAKSTCASFSKGSQTFLDVYFIR